MRWFKHFSDANGNKKLLPLLRKTGPSGYGRWWILLETVAAQMSEDSGHILTYSRADWAKILRTKPEHCENFLTICQQLNLLVFTRSGDDLTISIPKLLEIKDEYSQRSGHNRESVGRKSGECPASEGEGDKEGEGEGEPRQPKTLKSFNNWLLKREGDLIPFFETSYAHVGGVKHLQKVVMEIREAIFLNPEDQKWLDHAKNGSWGDVVRGWNRIAIREAGR